MNNSYRWKAYSDFTPQATYPAGFHAVQQTNLHVISGWMAFTAIIDSSPNAVHVTGQITSIDRTANKINYAVRNWYNGNITGRFHITTLYYPESLA